METLSIFFVCSFSLGDVKKHLGAAHKCYNDTENPGNAGMSRSFAFFYLNDLMTNQLIITVLKMIIVCHHDEEYKRHFTILSMFYRWCYIFKSFILKAFICVLTF